MCKMQGKIENLIHDHYKITSLSNYCWFDLQAWSSWSFTGFPHLRHLRGCLFLLLVGSAVFELACRASCSSAIRYKTKSMWNFILLTEIRINVIMIAMYTTIHLQSSCNIPKLFLSNKFMC